MSPKRLAGKTLWGEEANGAEDGTHLWLRTTLGDLCDPTTLLCCSALAAVAPLSCWAAAALALPLCPLSETWEVREQLGLGHPSLNDAVASCGSPGQRDIGIFQTPKDDELTKKKTVL